MAEWTFLTHHAHVLLAVAADNDATVRDIAAQVGISTRSAVTILNDLEAEAYLDRHRRGRRNHYVVHPERPLRHPANASHTVGDLIRALSDVR
ncbi:helix-turn-helix transcriptional regulator [Demequina sp. SO4-13]|uniref:helix-turn-helix transcriptional regulator n=1 Tax=Demequina sp. SO4-13 TaxID=3401027 RepID=UPI003AF61F8B